MQITFDNDIQQCIKTLLAGKIILYPTDTVWGIGCDATNAKAVNKIFKIKKRAESKSMIILLTDEKDIFDYADNPEPEILHYITSTSQPTTAIYNKGKNIANNLINKDGSIAIRIVHDDFCKALINAFGKSIVSTSANISGAPVAVNFKEIAEEIKNGVDYIVQHRRDDFKVAKPSAIIKLDEEKKIVFIRL